MASEPGLCIDVICTSRTQRVVGGDSHTACHQHFILIHRYCGMKLPEPPYMSTYTRPVPLTDMQLVLHKGGWRLYVSPTLVELDLTTVVLAGGQIATS